MKQIITTLFMLTTLVAFSQTLACSSTQIQNTIREHRIVLKPGTKIRPRSYESGNGNTEYLDTGPETGDTLLLIIRGEL